jgi:hypothetical protein
MTTCETLCAGRVNLFAEVSVFSIQVVFQYVVAGEMVSSETIFQVNKNVEVGRC